MHIKNKLKEQLTMIKLAQWLSSTRPITTDLRQLSLTANNITAKLTNQTIRLTTTSHLTPMMISVEVHQRQQSFAELHSPERSDYTITCICICFSLFFHFCLWFTCIFYFNSHGIYSGFNFDGIIKTSVLRKFYKFESLEHYLLF